LKFTKNQLDYSHFTVITYSEVAITFPFKSDAARQTSLITASRRQELRIGAAEGVAEKVEGLHGTLLAAP
jgi:hypothetical protein